MTSFEIEPGIDDEPAGRVRSVRGARQLGPDPGTSAWAVPPWLHRWSSWTARLLVIGVGILVALWIVSVLRVVFVPALIGLLLAALSSPLTTFLTARRVPRILAAWSTVLLVFGVLGGVGHLVSSSVGAELSEGTDWNEVYDRSREWLRDGPFGLTDAEIDDARQGAQDALIGGIRSIGIARAMVALEVIGGAFLSIVLFFFFLKDGPSMWSWVVGRFEPQRAGSIDAGGRAAFSALKAYTRGVAITGVVDAVLIGIALWVIGVPLVIPLAILTFFAAFFPIVGATLTGALSTVVALVANGPRDAILIALATLVIQQVEGDVVLPIVMRHQVRLHPAVILVVLGIGGALAGIVGAFVAVPIAAMINAAASAIASSRSPLATTPGIDST